MNLISKTRMFMPGPTPYLPEAMVQALVTPMHHRKEDFKELFRQVQAGLQQVFKTSNEVLILACSGSGGMEAAMVNTMAPGEKALLAVAGKFGERWIELADTYGIDKVVIQVPYGDSVEPAQIDAALDAHPDISAIFLQATETSTGAMMDLEGIAAQVRRRGDPVLVTDAITGLGTTPINTDEWGIDIVIGGSQKAFMLPPGVAMLSISERAWRRIEKCGRPRYYLDLRRERKAQAQGQSAYTPAVSIIQGLKSALDLILKMGVDGLVANAGLQAGATRAAILRWGMQIFPRVSGNAVTAFVPPAGVDPSKVMKMMRDRFGVLISGGQGSMKGKILRIGHLGYFDFLETLGMIGCLEIALTEAGASLETGSGCRAALEYYREFGKNR
ncbi:MAG: phosphoserine aminotransferase / L-aspartate aminotransferase [Acidobacteria bacterium]|nr:phosphoserine aminotransferase / L-aspartate aminotransferase [Acidobacteriota bacterium]